MYMKLGSLQCRMWALCLAFGRRRSSVGLYVDTTNYDLMNGDKVPVIWKWSWVGR